MGRSGSSRNIFAGMDYPKIMGRSSRSHCGHASSPTATSRRPTARHAHGLKPTTGVVGRTAVHRSRPNGEGVSRPAGRAGGDIHTSRLVDFRRLLRWRACPGGWVVGPETPGGSSRKVADGIFWREAPQANQRAQQAQGQVQQAQTQVQQAHNSA
jgi:hypothetical protein